MLGGALALASSPVVGTAQDVDRLIASMEKASEEAGAKNEEVKQREDDIRQASAEIAELEKAAKEATVVADEALAAERTFQNEVNRLAVVKYRGANTDVMSTVLNSAGPQVVIDRAAYIQALSRNTEATVEGLAAQTAVANEKRNKANQTLEAAQFRRAEMEAQVKKLEQEQAELKKQMDDIVASVESLSPADRQRWADKNGPLELSIAQVSGGNPSGLGVLEAGLTKVGSPYGWGAAGPSAFDCSGLVLWSYAQQGKTVPRTSQAQMAGGTPVSRDQLQPGDVVGFYPGATHVGIYAGDGKVLHASTYGIPVQVVSMDSMPFYGARRY